ncbi:MAG: hypothetical protein K1X55_03355 [Chitinophagales bacterium]|nr:hypothetical protein [Chitinophagales bacterium]
MRQVQLFVICILSVFLTTSCMGRYYRGVIVKKPLEKNSIKEIKKIVSIAPDVYYLEKKKTFPESYDKTAEVKSNFLNSLKYCADKNDIKLSIVEPEKIKETDSIYYNLLKPLKDQVFSAITFQNIKLEQTKVKLFVNRYTQKTRKTVVTQKINPDFEELIEKYGTKYFAIQGVISVKNTYKSNYLYLFVAPLKAFKGNYVTLYYNIIVDAELGEIVYLEELTMKEKPSQTYLDNVIYNSFLKLKSLK